MDYLSKQAPILHTMGSQLSSSLNSIPAEHNSSHGIWYEAYSVSDGLAYIQGTKLWLIIKLAVNPLTDLSSMLRGSLSEELLRVTGGQPLYQNPESLHGLLLSGILRAKPEPHRSSILRTSQTHFVTLIISSPIVCCCQGFVTMPVIYKHVWFPLVMDPFFNNISYSKQLFSEWLSLSPASPAISSSTYASSDNEAISRELAHTTMMNAYNPATVTKVGDGCYTEGVRARGWGHRQNSRIPSHVIRALNRTPSSWWNGRS